MPGQLFSLICISHAEVDLESVEAASIYLDGRRRNIARGITSHLHREGDTFLFYAEGPEQALHRLIIGLRRDWRHSRMMICDRGTVDMRLYEGWAMAITDRSMISYAAWTSTQGIEIDPWLARSSTLRGFFTWGRPHLEDLSRVRPELFPGMDGTLQAVIPTDGAAAI